MPRVDHPRARHLVRLCLLVATFAAGQAACTSTRNDGVAHEGGTAVLHDSPETDLDLPAHDAAAPSGGETAQPWDDPSFVPPPSGLPVIRIETEDRAPIESKDVSLSATIVVESPDAGRDHAGGVRIRGRGNTTWNMPKRPYRLRLDEPVGLLGLDPATDWVLLANYADKSLLRTAAAFELGHRLGVPFTPTWRHVELWVNDVYAGLYQLTTQVQVHEHRVAIAPMTPRDLAGRAVTGGYLLEIDARLDDDVCFTTRAGVSFCVKAPGAIAPVQLAYVTAYVQAAEDALYGDDFTDAESGYAGYIDVATFVDWYLVSELLRDNDSTFHSSVYVHKDREGLLRLGPLWDFDLAAGNIDHNDNDLPQGFLIRGAPWFDRLLEDPDFAARVRARWDAVRHQVETIVDFIDESAAEIAVAADSNFQRWPILDRYVWPNAVVTGRYERELAYLKGWLLQRIAWLDRHL